MEFAPLALSERVAPRSPPPRRAGPAHMATGLAVFIAEKRAELAPGAEELDWEDEWDDLTLQQQAPYIERATAVSQAPAPAPAPPPKPAVAQAPVHRSLCAAPPSPRPAASPAKPKPASSSGAGASGSKPSPMDSPSGKRKKSGELRKPRSAFELFASRLRKQASDSERSLDDEPPDLGQASRLPSPVARRVCDSAEPP